MNKIKLNIIYLVWQVFNKEHANSIQRMQELIHHTHKEDDYNAMDVRKAVAALSCDKKKRRVLHTYIHILFKSTAKRNVAKTGGLPGY